MTINVTLVQIGRILRPYRTTIVSISLLLLCVVAVVVGVVPAYKKASTMRSNAKELSETVMLLRNKIDLLNSTDEDTLRSQVALTLSAIPSDKSVASLFSTIEGVANLSGVTLADITVSAVGKIATNSGVTKNTEEIQLSSTIMPFAASINGTYQQIRDFLEAANSVRRFVRVQAFSLAKGEGDVLTMSADMNAFYTPLPTSIGKPSDRIEAFTQDDQDLLTSISSMQLVGESGLQPQDSEPLPFMRDDPFSY
ncbi:type 4a pilus biogenesis protein PilO [Patescibacteria group bacterium]|nr:type 4a pilus biogenesis protein PilO [Patescibacteria group bacterium]MBU1472424.1 type 4a pilus biogenesis protein PilO [Patescibacteria group bacterium]MBU2460239.1 type 4a pilus biogenesis protein PilO [Patescibacteria group bacterium]MBU2544556.1 type 4a pilus biogenesis protein PilO [Patescibacteria group bacterium]